MIPSAPGHDERGEEFERVVLVGDGLGREAGLPGVALPAVDGAEGVLRCIVPVELAQRHESTQQHPEYHRNHAA
jgi:hypothetical protein